MGKTTITSDVPLASSHTSSFRSLEPQSLPISCTQGNEKFIAKDNVGALKLYTESVICAPQVGPELALAFGNRSVTL